MINFLCSEKNYKAGMSTESKLSNRLACLISGLHSRPFDSNE